MSHQASAGGGKVLLADLKLAVQEPHLGEGELGEEIRVRHAEGSAQHTHRFEPRTRRTFL